ncbi:hypothetical protein NESM_000577900 [Novymonas esmeraldas]|uniref:Uncharacterized protein n=1 Tax=Novymonas esmeraldas TaxID=1808958 RepID=A0AAW0ETV6_9TRYP
MRPSDRDVAGAGGFNNPYTNSTLVGNWLEDRQQRRRYFAGRGGAATTWCADGIFDDPAVSASRNPAEAQAALLHSTYQVSFGGRRPTGADARAAAAAPAAATLMLGSRHTSGGGATTTCTAKGGVDKVLLFSVDPVADPAAPLPRSTNADTYGASYYCADSTGNTPTTAMGDSGVDGEQLARAAVAGGDGERNLYDSVSRSAAAVALAPSLASGGTRGLRHAPATTATSALRRHTLRRSGGGGARTTTAHTGWTLSCVSTEAGDDADSRGRLQPPPPPPESAVGDRWTTSKQSADVPVEHYALQRRLPPIRQ